MAEPSDTSGANGAARPRSLDEIRPRWSLHRKILSVLLGLLAVAVLLRTYRSTRIDPLVILNNRDKAATYLFGKTLSEDEIADARREAERYPEIIAREEARARIREEWSKKYPDPADEPPYAERKRAVEERTRRILAKQPEAEKQEIIEDALRKSLDKKRGGYFPPETSGASLETYFWALMETVAIAIWASLLAVLFAVPISLFAARNTLAIIAPGEGRVHRLIRGFAVWGVRRFLDFCRAFNELVMALIFIAVVGLGPFAGVLALWIHTTGILGKVFSEAIEAIDPGQVEALSSTGASAPQTISFSVLPQIMPAVVSYSLLRFESNVRSAAILGYVGAGGIGFLLQDAMGGYKYREVCTMMIMIIVAVTVIDFFCGKLRRRFI
jgi:phosphonate transport system permease protein